MAFGIHNLRFSEMQFIARVKCSDVCKKQDCISKLTGMQDNTDFP